MTFSAITCCYNPDNRILAEVLNAIGNLIVSQDNIFEHLIVDNNSTPPLRNREYVQQYLASNTHASIIVEEKQGLTESRLAGFRASKGEVIIFFDDDNVPDASYLQNIALLMSRHPHVGIWGPGDVTAVYEEGVEEKVKKITQGIFQEKHTTETKFACDIAADCNPLGTGMVVKREILQEYMQNYQAGVYSNSDRKGKSLSTGGDIQIVYTAIKKGIDCGTSPLLKIEHWIPLKRTKITYISRLVFGYGASIQSALVEVFPEKALQITLPDFLIILASILKRSLLLYSKYYSWLQYKMDVAYLIGEAVGSFKLHNQKEPYWLKILVNIFKVR